MITMVTRDYYYKPVAISSCPNVLSVYSHVLVTPNFFSQQLVQHYSNPLESNWTLSVVNTFALSVPVCSDSLIVVSLDQNPSLLVSMTAPSYELYLVTKSSSDNISHHN